jgi:hypothetical protein
MPASPRNAVPPEPKAAVTVAEMARRCGLSRARFYELMNGGVFPQPQRRAETARPFFDREGQDACLRVKATNQGVNGQPVLFYSRRPTEATGPRTLRAARRRSDAGGPQQSASDGPMVSLVQGLRLLGLDDASPDSIRAAAMVCFPEGLQGVEDGAALTAIYRHLKRRNSGDNVGR